MASGRTLADREFDRLAANSKAGELVTCNDCGFGAIRGLPSFLVSKQTINDSGITTTYVHGKSEVCAMLVTYAKQQEVLP